MLYLTRKIGETIVINGNIYITIVETKGNKSVKIGCEFPKEATVLRKEVHDKISKENIAASTVNNTEEALDALINLNLDEKI
jgi:carbon storage regulator